MINNPFTSSIFVTTWCRHFYKSAKVERFGFIKKIAFIKKSFLPIYINVGKSMTKGLSYEISDAQQDDFRNKLFLIYDIPDYVEMKNKIVNSSLRLRTIKQYSGYLVDIQKYLDIDSYKKSKFGKSSLCKIRKYERKLESCFDVKYVFYFGEISKEIYELIFGTFNELLEKRFSCKKVHNNNLDSKEWGFYKDLIYGMILEKKASIFAIYDGNKPIGGSINYHSEDVAIGAIMVFDIDYSKFYIGFTIISKLIEWAIDNGLKFFDFSKGKFDYKIQWSDKAYDFRYHVLYDGDSWRANIISYVMASYFKFKEYLRSKNVNEIRTKVLFMIKRKKNKKSPEYDCIDITASVNDNLVRIHINKVAFGFLRIIVYNFLYSKSEHINDVDVYQYVNEENSFLVAGKLNKQKVVFK